MTDNAIVPDPEMNAFLGKMALGSLAWGQMVFGLVVALFAVGLVILLYTGPIDGEPGGWPDAPPAWTVWSFVAAMTGVALLLLVGGWRLRQRRLSGQTYAFIGNGILLLAGLAYTAWNGDWLDQTSMLLGPLVILLLLRSKHTVSLLVNP